MSRPTDLKTTLAVAAVLLVMLACDLGAPAPTPVPVRTLDPAQQYLGPTLSSLSQYRPSAAGWIAFVKDGSLWLVHPDGSGLKQVTGAGPGGGPLKLAWSPDGQLLAFSQDGVLSVLNVAGLGTTVLAKDVAGGFDWSATAHQLIYDTALSSDAAGASSNTGLAVVSTDNNATRSLARSTGEYPAMLSPLWSFDSRSVIFTVPGRPGLRLLHAETGQVSELLPGSSAQLECSWSPLELLIACVDGSPAAGTLPGVVLLDQDGVQQKRFELQAGQTHARLGPWSPDGGSLAVSYATGPDGSDEQTDLLSVDSGAFRTLGPGRAASWSPDERWMVTVGPGSSESRQDLPITVINTTSRMSASIAEGSSPAWQPASSTDLLTTAATLVPQGQTFCMNTAVGFVHKKPKGYFLIFCIGAQKYNYGALASGYYIVGPEARFFVYVSNMGFVYAARMGDATLTRIGNVRWFRAIQLSDIDPEFELRFITGYPHLVQVVEKRFMQKDTFTLPHRIYTP